MVFAVAAGLLAGVVPAMVSLQVPDEGRSRAWILTLVVMCWSGIRLAHRIASGKPKLFDFVFWLFAYIFMGLAPTVQIRSNEVSTTTPGINPLLDMPAAGAVLVGLLCYEVGSAVARRRTPPSDAESAAVAVDGLRAAILTAVGVLAAAYFVSKVGFSTLFLNRYAAGDAVGAGFPDRATRSIVGAAASYPLLIAGGAFLRLWFTSPPSLKRDRYALGTLVSIPLLLIMVNPISSARYDFGTVGFALIVLVGAMASRVRASISMAVTVFAFLFIFPIADAFRSEEINVRRSGFFGEYAGNPDYDAFWQLANTLAYLNDFGIKWLSQFSGVLLFWVPRAIWPDKPVDTGILLARYRGYSFDNLSAPLWAEFLINGGWLLLILGFIAVGYLLVVLDRRSSAALLNRGQLWSIVGAVFPFYMVILLRGSLLQATGTFLVAILSVLFIWRPRRRSHSAIGPPAAAKTELEDSG